MNSKQLSEYLAQKCDIKLCAINNYKYVTKSLPFLKLRDIIMAKRWKIHYEDSENQVYIVSVRGGFLGRNTAVVAFHLSDDLLFLSVSAEEGIINQHTCEDVNNDIYKALQSYIAT